MNEEIKPKLGQKVYGIFEDSIEYAEVRFLGKDSFLFDPYDKIEGSFEYWYEDFGEKWFFDGKEAKTALLKKMYEYWGDEYDFEVDKVTDSYWEARRVIKEDD